jgi:hypothetical protein
MTGRHVRSFLFCASLQSREQARTKSPTPARESGKLGGLNGRKIATLCDFNKLAESI